MFFCYWGTIINYKLDNYILELICLPINTFFFVKYSSPDSSLFLSVAKKPPLLYSGTPHLDQIDSHQFGLVLFQHAFFAVYPAYPTTNGCRFRHRIIYPFFCACPGFPLLFCFSFVFANFGLEFEFQVLCSAFTLWCKYTYKFYWRCISSESLPAALLKDHTLRCCP